MDPIPTADGKSVSPSADAEAPQTLGAWFRQNGVQLAVVVAVIVAVCSYLHPMDVLLAGLGLSLIIFIHELGHFLAAKWCDVHVKTFSIGFGPAVPFCSYKWGETTYMVGIIPLGGYVSMVGEGDNAGDEDAEEDPRSFRHKSVGQRMLIISAGVIMNILLGMACFVASTTGQTLCVTEGTVGIDDEASATGRLTLQVVPNPASGRTRVTLVAGEPGEGMEQVRVGLFDATGAQVLDLSESFARSGYRYAEFDASSIAAGSYFVRAVGGGFNGVVGTVTLGR